MLMSVEMFIFDSSRSPVSFLRLIDFGDRTEWSPNRPVLLREININKIGLPSSESPICLMTSTITNRIVRHEVLLPINDN